MTTKKRDRLSHLCTSGTLQEPFADILAMINASLYTADAKYLGHCDISVVKCFYLEMKVLSYEAYIGGNETFYDKVHRVVRSLEAFLKGKQDKEAPQCQECETFEEKKYIEFMKTFENIVQELNKNAGGKYLT